MGLFGPPNIEKLQAKGDVEALIKALGTQKDAGVRKKAAVALGEVGNPRAIEALITAFKDSENEVRRASSVALGQIGDPRAVEMLIALLRGQNYFVSVAATEALGYIGARLGDSPPRDQTIKALINILKEEDSSIYPSLAEALGLIGAPAVNPLIAALKDGEVKARKRVINVLGQIGANLEDAALTTRAVTPLIGVLQNDKYLGGDAVIALQQIYPHLENEALRGFITESFIAALKHDQMEVRSRVLSALGQMGNARAVEPLITVLQHDFFLSREIAVALQQISSHQTDPVLHDRITGAFIETLKYKSRDVADSLGQMGDGRGVEPLSALLADEDWSVRKVAAEALIKLYQSGNLDETHKQLILSQRDRIKLTHSDQVYQPSSDCTDPHHSDNNGIGVSFPL